MPWSSFKRCRLTCCCIYFLDDAITNPLAKKIPNAPMLDPKHSAVEMLLFVTNACDISSKKGELFQFHWIFKADTGSLWMCEEQPMLISMHVVGLYCDVIKALEPLCHF